MPPHNLNTAESSISRTNDDNGRRAISNEQPTPDFAAQPEMSPSLVRDLSLRHTTPPDTNDSDGPSIRSIRYEDTIEGAGENRNPQVSLDSSSLHGSRDHRMTVRSEIRTEAALSHIPEDFDTEPKSVSPRLDSKTPKKEAPTFAVKRRSISGSFNSLRRAGTKLVRRGIQGVLPVTPRKSGSAPINTASALEDVSDRNQDEILFRTPGHQLFDDLYDVTPPRQEAAKFVAIVEEFTPAHGMDRSNDTERTFYDAREVLVPALGLTATNLTMVIPAIEVSGANNNAPRKQYPLRTSSWPTNVVAQGQYPPRVSSMENIVTRINRRESAINESENVGCTALSSRRTSRLSFASSQGLRELREVSLHEAQDQRITDTSQNVPSEAEAPNRAGIEAVENTPREIEAPEQSIQAETMRAPRSLFELVKEFLRQPGDDDLIAVNKPMEVVRVSTKGVNFRSAHKNFFPVWADGAKRDGRRYTQEEVVNIITGST